MNPKKARLAYDNLSVKELASIGIAALARGDENEFSKIEQAAEAGHDLLNFDRDCRRIFAATQLWGRERLKLEINILIALHVVSKSKNSKRDALSQAFELTKAYEEVAARLASQFGISEDVFWSLSSVEDTVPRLNGVPEVKSTLADQIFEQFECLADYETY